MTLRWRGPSSLECTHPSFRPSVTGTGRDYSSTPDSRAVETRCWGCPPSTRWSANHPGVTARLPSPADHAIWPTIATQRDPVLPGQARRYTVLRGRERDNALGIVVAGVVHQETDPLHRVPILGRRSEPDIFAREPGPECVFRQDHRHPMMQHAHGRGCLGGEDGEGLHAFGHPPALP